MNELNFQLISYFSYFPPLLLFSFVPQQQGEQSKDLGPLIPWHIAAVLTEATHAHERASKKDSDETLLIERGIIFKNLLLESVLVLLEEMEDGDGTGVLRMIEGEIDKYDAKEEREKDGERGEIVRAVKEGIVSALSPSFLCILTASTPALTATSTPAPTSAIFQTPTLFSTLPYCSEDRSALLTMKLLFSSLNVILAARRTPFLALVLPLISDFLLRFALGK